MFFVFLLEVCNWLLLLASEQDTIRGVQIRAGAVCIYIYGGMCAIIVAHATHT